MHHPLKFIRISLLNCLLIANASQATPLDKIASMSCGYQQNLQKGSELNNRKPVFKAALAQAQKQCITVGNMDAAKKYSQQATNCTGNDNGHNCQLAYHQLQNIWCGYQSNPLPANTTNPTDLDFWHMNQATNISNIQCESTQGVFAVNAYPPGAMPYFIKARSICGTWNPPTTCANSSCVLNTPMPYSLKSGDYDRGSSFNATACIDAYLAISQVYSPY